MQGAASFSFIAALGVLVSVGCSSTPGVSIAAGTMHRASNPARFAGCPIFTKNDYYNRPVVSAPVDPHSIEYIASMTAAGNVDGFRLDAPVEYINIANDRTPLLTVAQKVPYHSFPHPVPWAPAFAIEPLRDAHAIVVKTGACRLFELYNASYTDSTLSAYSGASWDLRKPFVPLPPGTPSSMASGLPMFGGLIKWEEIASGHIDHALNWAPPAGTVSKYGFVRPASSTDALPYKGSNRFQLPYGAHLRLHASFDITRLSPQARVIAQAMKTYGIYLADTGSEGNQLYDAVALSGRGDWDMRDLRTLESIHITDFDVLRLGARHNVPRANAQ